MFELEIMVNLLLLERKGEGNEHGSKLRLGGEQITGEKQLRNWGSKVLESLPV